MKVWLWPAADNHRLLPSGLTSRVSCYLTVLQRVQIRDGRSVISCGFGREFDSSFSTYRGLPLAQPCWGYYIVGDELYSSCLLASLALLPVTNPHPTSSHIWWLYPLCLHRRPQPVHDLWHGMLHTFNFLQMAMKSTPYLIFISSVRRSSKKGKKMGRRAHPKSKTDFYQSKQCHLR